MNRLPNQHRTLDWVAKTLTSAQLALPSSGFSPVWQVEELRQSDRERISDAEAGLVKIVDCYAIRSVQPKAGTEPRHFVGFDRYQAQSLRPNSEFLIPSHSPCSPVVEFRELVVPLCDRPALPLLETKPMTTISKPVPSSDLAVLGKDDRLIAQPPTNFESRLDLMDGLITPNELFFIRSNGPISVTIDPADWRLTVSGLVERALTISLADLQAMPNQTITAFLECSGNSRAHFPVTPAAVEGTNWGDGAIGNAEWTGTSLRNVLEQAGVRRGAVDVVSQGADFDGMQRGLPIATALDPNVMLVWQMNGEDLPAPNGGPVRMIVPGWGAIASTKWLVGLELIDHPFTGFWNTENYVLLNAEGAPIGPVQQMPVKSIIARPIPGSKLSVGVQTLDGFAWSGHGGIARVDVSTDGGTSWSEARIVQEAGPFSWVRFEHEWEAASGDNHLQSRATDTAGNTQPTEAIWNQKGYQMNAISDVPVTVA